MERTAPSSKPPKTGRQPAPERGARLRPSPRIYLPAFLFRLVTAAPPDGNRAETWRHGRVGALWPLPAPGWRERGRRGRMPAGSLYRPDEVTRERHRRRCRRRAGAGGVHRGGRRARPRRGGSPGPGPPGRCPGDPVRPRRRLGVLRPAAQPVGVAGGGRPVRRPPVRPGAGQARAGAVRPQGRGRPRRRGRRLGVAGRGARHRHDGRLRQAPRRGPGAAASGPRRARPGRTAQGGDGRQGGRRGRGGPHRHRGRAGRHRRVAAGRRRPPGAGRRPWTGAGGGSSVERTERRRPAWTVPQPTCPLASPTPT